MYRNTAKLAISAILCALAFGSAHGQAGCYFGVCPGDVGTEFPDQPTARLPAPVPAPSPQPSSSPSPAPQPAPLPTDVPGLTKKRLDALCRSAFFIGEELSWWPPMGIRNALAVCEEALRNNPKDLDLRFAYAVARNMNAAPWGTPADNFYAVTAYRELVADRHPLASYALATMHDEDAGVSTAEALSSFASYRANAATDSVHCLVHDEEFQFPELAQGRSRAHLLAEMEQGAAQFLSCSRSIVRAFWGDWTSYTFVVPFEAHIKSAAVHADVGAMNRLGYFYASGAGNHWVDGLAPHVTLPKDPERGGYWLILAHYMSTQNFSPAGQDTLLRAIVADRDYSRAAQTALRALGFYNGSIDGSFGPASRAALEAFVASDLPDALFQRVRAAEIINPMLAPMVPMRIGIAALLE